MAEVLKEHVWMMMVVVVVVVMVVMAIRNLVLNANSQVPLQREAQLSAKIARV